MLKLLTEKQHVKILKDFKAKYNMKTLGRLLKLQFYTATKDITYCKVSCIKKILNHLKIPKSEIALSDFYCEQAVYNDEDDNYKKGSKNILDYMEILNFRQKDACKKLGVSRSTISRWVNEGGKIPKAVKVKMLEDIKGVL